MTLKVRPVITKPKVQSHVTIEEFIIWYIEKYGKAYVHEMLDAYNAQHFSNKPAKYTSFRTVVWNLKDDKLIVSTDAPPGDVDRGGFPKSYYKRTTKPYVKKVSGR